MLYAQYVESVNERVLPFDSAEVAELLHDFGEIWQIERQTSPTAWVAVRRVQPPLLEIHCAVTIEELREKLVRASSRSRYP